MHLDASLLSFDEAKWEKLIAQPDWYLHFVKEAEEVQAKASSETLDKFRKDSRHFFARALIENKVALAQEGPNLDSEREPVDTIVIHHTSHHPGYELDYLNAVQMLTIYAPYFSNPTVPGEESLKGQALWSGHFRAGMQVFWGYHWLMRMDGTFERLLNDTQLGWHAGNWRVNRRSIGICLDNDYEKQNPNEKTLRALAAHIRSNYRDVKPENIIGHCEAKQGTICPGTHFIDKWKPTLIQYLKEVK